MTLAQYRSKRNFQNTPEPKGGKGNNNKLHFVVQKHAASHLHYDFRLELSGVLKSWAIPNGPSLDPREKRLAIMVEDHPLDYRTFEGVIPEGNYGAGTVMVWDKGTYQNYKKSSAAAASKNLKEGLSSGDLKFILDGKKLKGAFVLVKMKGSNDDKNWLLIKKKDSFATTADPLEKDHSVLSGLPFTEIQTQKAPRINKKILDLRGAKRVKQPKSFSPMLATLVYEPFDDPDWISEVKWDGYRIIAFVEDGEVQLRSRNEKDYTSIFKPVADELRTLDFNCVLDGEIAVADREGRSDFSALQNYQKTGRGNLCYFVFDLPFANGYDLRDLTLLRRKNALQSIVNGMEYIKYSDHISGKMPEMFREAVKNNLEGIMAKDASSKYVSGKRSRSWLKIKVHKRQEAVIGGFTAPKGSRIKLGSLILGIYENQKLVYVGHTGGGLSNRTLEDLYNRLHPLERKTSPFSSNFRVNAPVTWVDPKLVCEVTFAEWTPEGRMRQPIFVGLREDKNPKLATREEPKEISELAEKGAAKTRRTRNKLTHLDKIYWPDEGYTKGDLL
ncbi:MAG: DNA ligase, partial [Actinomycetota bacterium]